MPRLNQKQTIRILSCLGVTPPLNSDKSNESRLIALRHSPGPSRQLLHRQWLMVSLAPLLSTTPVPTLRKLLQCPPNRVKRLECPSNLSNHTSLKETLPPPKAPSCHNISRANHPNSLSSRTQDCSSRTN